MKRIRVTATEQGQLEHTFKTTTDRRLRDWCQAVLMASRGRKRRAIAQDLGVHRTTVRRWLTQYQARDVGPDDPRVGERRSPGVWARSGELDL
jgi:hypothetical protein